MHARDVAPLIARCAGNIDAWIVLTREGNFDPLSEDLRIEPSVMRPMPDLGGAYIINMEEEVLITESGSEYLTPRQTELILIEP